MPRERTKEPERVERNGWQYVEWYDPAAGRVRRQSLGTQDPREGLRRFAEFVLRGETGRNRGSAGLTVRQALDDYVEQHVKATDDRGRPRVVDSSRVRVIVGHLKAHFGDTLVKDVDIAASRVYLNERRKVIAGGSRPRKNTVKDSTIRRELAVLVSAANHAVRWRTLDRSDLPQVELPAPDQVEDPKWFTKEQIQSLLQNTDGDLNRFIRIAYYTAARRRSIEQLTRFQVKLDEGAIYLQKPGERITRKRRPVVPIFPEIRPVVEELFARGGNYLFGDAPPNFYPGFKEACDVIGVEGHPHMLRHSRASHMLQDGEDIWKVARLLGDTVRTVERVYAHCMPQHLLTESNVEDLPAFMR